MGIERLGFQQIAIVVHTGVEQAGNGFDFLNRQRSSRAAKRDADAGRVGGITAVLGLEVDRVDASDKAGENLEIAAQRVEAGGCFQAGALAVENDLRPGVVRRPLANELRGLGIEPAQVKLQPVNVNTRRVALALVGLRGDPL